MSFDSSRRSIKAVLGPTNTGKTWYAIDRMLGHRTGMIGLPLRLLAREVYDRVRAARGPLSVALVTGEERIIPKQAQYWVCTVEAMPQASGVDFLAVDEIQLCGDPERGHIFTQRLLSARGQIETVFLGSDTMRPAIAELVPEVSFGRRDRLSGLSYTGFKKIDRIKSRSAIVGFSVEDVYAIAEVVRQRRGGAAVVLGALSPRTRNAQVELYQNGDVEVLVATDAIGMGLNLDIDHVAFAGLKKFDGRRVRSLWPHEIGQIAGRAGRFQSPGTFGVTADARPLDPILAKDVEDGRFSPLKQLQWRNDALAFRSVDALIASLQAPSEKPLLAKARDADDFLALRAMAELPEIRGRVNTIADVRLLWDVCQIPDFRKVSLEDHSELLNTVFTFLQEHGHIPYDWLEAQVRRIDRVDGDVEALSRRIAFIRTWTYLSQKSDWTEDSQYWRERTRSVEDRISDALHAGLTRRFVDRRVSVLMKEMKRKDGLLAEVDNDGLLTVEGETVGRIEGFRFMLDETATVEEAKTLRQASAKALERELTKKALRLYNAPDKEIGLTNQGGLMWGEFAIGKLVAGAGLYDPGVEVFVDEEAGAETKQRVEGRLKGYIKQKIFDHCGELLRLKEDESITGLARGVAYRIHESYGIMLRRDIGKDVKELDQDARKLLRAHGVRFGQHAIFVYSALKPEATRLRIILWGLSQRVDDIPEPPPPGLVTLERNKTLPDGYFPLSGFFAAGGRAIRIDMLDRLANLLRDANDETGFEATVDMLSLSGSSPEVFAELMAGLGFRVERGERERKRRSNDVTVDPEIDNDSGIPIAEKEAEAGSSAIIVASSQLSVETVGNESEASEPQLEVYYRFFRRPKAKRRLPLKKSTDQKFRQQDRRTDKRPKKKGKPLRKEKPHSVESINAAQKQTVIDPDSPFAVLAQLKKRIGS